MTINSVDGAIRLRVSNSGSTTHNRNRSAWIESILSSDDIAYLIADAKQTEIKYCIRRLRKAGLIVKIPNMKDLRRVIYRLAEPDEILAGLEYVKKSQVPELRPIVQTKRLPVQYQINKIQEQ